MNGFPLGQALLLAGAFSHFPFSQGIALEPGEPLPAFDLLGVDDRRHSHEDFAQAKVLVVVFTCNHCPSAQAYEGRLNAFVADYSPKNVALVAISPNDPEAIKPDALAYSDMGDTFAEMKIRAKQAGFAFPYLYDGETQETSKTFGVSVTPQVFVFDSDRSLRYVGRIDNSETPEKANRKELRGAVDALLVGKSPPTTESRLLGCPVKWTSERPLVKRMRQNYLRETVALRKADQKTLQFVRQNKSTRLKMFYVWSLSDKKKHDPFSRLLEMHHIYRKRGLEWLTVCVDGKEASEQALQFLRDAHASGRNFLCSGAELFPLADLRGETSERATPFLALVAPGGEVLYRSTAGVDELAIKRKIIARFGNQY